MSRLSLILFLGISFLGYSLHALPVLNPAAPALVKEGVFKCDACDFWGLKLGYRGDFVFNRHYNVNGTDVAFALFANEGVIALNMWDRVDIYGFIGSASFNTEAHPQDPNLGTLFDAFTTRSRTRTIGGLGVKATIWEICWLGHGITYIGIDAQYEWMGKTSIDKATIQGINVNTNGVGRSYREGQVSLGVGHKIGTWVPYIAGKWSNARANASGQVGAEGSLTPGTVLNLGKYHASSQWGLAVGVSLVDAKRMLVTAEVRLIDETAMSIAADFRF
ncbi:MAG: hypothetical protein P4L16_00440 [Chlamydiales bacterium]|nr:hypothetical protein [Chlamydiales bacterium]